jgi:CheY-like chemotaxis protein
VTVPTSQRILVVEDLPEVRKMLRLLLEVKGFQVEEAGNGPEGVRKAIEWHPHVAVVDIGLPLLNGYEVARRVRSALGGDIRLIALTAYGTREDQERALAAGFDVHLTKPTDPDELCRHLRPA